MWPWCLTSFLSYRWDHHSFLILLCYWNSFSVAIRHFHFAINQFVSYRTDHSSFCPCGQLATSATFIYHWSPCRPHSPNAPWRIRHYRPFHFSTPQNPVSHFSTRSLSLQNLDWTGHCTRCSPSGPAPSDYCVALVPWTTPVNSMTVLDLLCAQDRHTSLLRATSAASNLSM